MNRGLLEDFKNAWGKPNNAVVQIILINVVVFVATGVMLILGFGDLIRPWLGLSSNTSTIVLRFWTIFTHFFVHDGFTHILFNLLWFYWFGRIIQEFLGSNKVISLYVLGGLVGALFFVAGYNLFGTFKNVVEIANLVGASAGVTAVVVGAAVYLPNYSVNMIFIGPVKIKYIALISVFLSLMGVRGHANPGGEFAHLGGAAIGWLYMSQLKAGNDIGGWIISFMDFVKSMFKPQPKIKVTHRGEKTKRAKKSSSPKPSAATETHTPQSEIDEILDKISEKGYESLSKEEKQKLFNASKK